MIRLIGSSTNARVIELDIRARTMRVLCEAGAPPMDVLLHHSIRYELRGAPRSMDALLARLGLLAERVVAGYAAQTIGGVSVGTLTTDAIVADDQIRELILSDCEDHEDCDCEDSAPSIADGFKHDDVPDTALESTWIGPARRAIN